MDLGSAESSTAASAAQIKNRNEIISMAARSDCNVTGGVKGAGIERATNLR
jgi:hypothetical protein